MNNLDIYEKLREVPKNAQKPIEAGRLKGKTDINPMWRIKALTEQFGACGIGWFTEITKQWIEEGGNNEKSAFVNINLYIKVNGEWSKPIQGTGGSSFVSNESKGLYTSDECFKMAYTDAISVSAKMLGVGADIYWKDDTTKYQKTNAQAENDTTRQEKQSVDKSIEITLEDALKYEYVENGESKLLKDLDTERLKKVSELKEEKYKKMSACAKLILESRNEN